MRISAIQPLSSIDRPRPTHHSRCCRRSESLRARVADRSGRGDGEHRAVSLSWWASRPMMTQWQCRRLSPSRRVRRFAIFDGSVVEHPRAHVEARRRRRGSGPRRLRGPACPRRGSFCRKSFAGAALSQSASSSVHRRRLGRRPYGSDAGNLGTAAAGGAVPWPPAGRGAAMNAASKTVAQDSPGARSFLRCPDTLRHAGWTRSRRFCSAS